MRKWLSIKLVQLATKIRPENREAQEYFMKVHNEDWATRKGSVEVITTWGMFKRDMEANRGFVDGKLVYGFKRGTKLMFTFVAYGEQLTVIPEVEHKSPAQLYSDGDKAEMEDEYGSEPKKT